MSTSTPKNDKNGKFEKEDFEEITLFTSEFETPEEKKEKAPEAQEENVRKDEISDAEENAENAEPTPDAVETADETPAEPDFDATTLPEDPFEVITTDEFDSYTDTTEREIGTPEETITDEPEEMIPDDLVSSEEGTDEAPADETSVEEIADESAAQEGKEASETEAAEDITAETEPEQPEVETIPADKPYIHMFSETADIGEEDKEDPAAATGEYPPVKTASEEQAEKDAGASKTSKYEELHSFILEKQSAAGNLYFKTAADIDIDKNIRDAETFVSQSENRETAEPSEDAVSAEASGVQTPVETPTEQIDTSETMIRKGKKKSRMKTYFAKEKTGEIDRGDLEMMLAFGLNPTTTQTIETSKMAETNTNAQIPQADGMNTTMGMTAAAPEFRPDVGTQYYEYSSDEQNKEVFSYYHKKYNRSKLRLWGAAILAALLLLLENLMTFGIRLPAAISPFTSPKTFALIDIILALLCTALVFDKLIAAVKSVIKLKPEPELILMVGAFFSMLGAVLILAYGPENTVMKYGRMYNFPYAVSILLAFVSDVLKYRREIYSFKIVASKKTKCVVERIENSEETPEAKAFDEYLPASPLLYRVGRAKKISGFFAKIREYPKIKKVLFIAIPLAILASVIMYIIDYFANGTGTFQSFSALTVTLQFCLPLSAFISFSYPLTHAAAVAYGYGSAMIGDVTVDRYTDASVISFDDTDVFPSDRTKIRAVKVLENNRIDEVIYYAASVFSQLGGPLRSVFNLAMLDIGHSEDVEILDVSDKGVEARVDGKSIVIGQQSYLERQCFETVFEEGDDTCSGKSSKRILYLACDNAVAAKIYIRYGIDPSFENILRRIYSAGMCVAVKSCDPNIDNALLSGKINLSKYPVRIIKCTSVDDMNKTKEESDSGIISTGSVRGILQALSLCDRLTHINRTNAVVKLLSTVLGIFSSALIIGSGVVSGVASLYLAAYQVFWMIPMLLLSKFYISASDRKEK